MNVASERAKEACDSCRKSHKKCTYNDDSARCLRCEKRDTLCSLFLSVDAPAVAEQRQDPPELVATGSAPDSWDATPHGPATSAGFSHQYPPQGDYYWTAATYTETTQGQYPVDMIYQPTANQHESGYPALNQDDLYGHNNVFSDHCT